MTLDDVFQPNQYGTIPIIEIYSVGTIMKHSDTVAKVSMDNRDDVYLPLTTTECEMYGSLDKDDIKIRVKHPSVDTYSKRIIHLKVADSSERLIVNAINPEEPLWYMTQEGLLRPVYEYEKHSILANGTGWVDIFSTNDRKPVTFYYEDILYRLDLQGELK